MKWARQVAQVYCPGYLGGWGQPELHGKTLSQEQSKTKTKQINVTQNMIPHTLGQAHLHWQWFIQADKKKRKEEKDTASKDNDW